MNEIKINRKNNEQESGAALVTVLMISVLLGIACIAMLSAAGANSRNSTDVLSETKAYYAAESGLQATINVLRGNTCPSPLFATPTGKCKSPPDTSQPEDPANEISYLKAVTSSTSNIAGEESMNARLSRWITYNYPLSGTANRVVVGQTAATYDPNSGTAYSVVVSDPDNSAASLTFNTSGTFTSYIVAGDTGDNATFSTDRKTIYIPNETASPRTKITFADAPSTTHTFTTSNPSLGSFSIVNEGVGVQITGEIKFRIDYRLTEPRPAVRSIYGSIKQASSTVLPVIIPQTQNYSLLGSTIQLCSTSTGCAYVFNLDPTQPSPLYANITPVHPYRLKVVSTGYGPNRARKQLEAIIQRNLFNGVVSGRGTTMIGKSKTLPTLPGELPFLFSPGTSNGVSYSGGDCTSTAGCVPSFGLTNTDNLKHVTDNPPAGGMQPPPALMDTNNTPEWLQSPQALDLYIDQMREAAQRSGRYFVNPSGNATNFTVGTNQNPPGSFTDGTGITFCEGSCNLGASGGGLLVVTGKLTNVGSFSFKGMIIVTGEEGWERNGAGQGQVSGSVVIAPYNRRTYIPEKLSSDFLAPRYNITGGGGSDVIYDNVSATLDNTSSVSDFMMGIAEK